MMAQRGSPGLQYSNVILQRVGKSDTVGEATESPRLEAEGPKHKKTLESTNMMEDAAVSHDEEDDSVCCICFNGDVEDGNEILFCDSCDIPVHQACYGVEEVPQGNWYCAKCAEGGDRSARCALCPCDGGALKRTVEGVWVHMYCALWVPEIGFGSLSKMEPVMDFDKIDPTRWRLKCVLCGQKDGACIQCIRPSCRQSFHAMCGHHAGLRMQITETHDKKDVLFLPYCAKHHDYKDDLSRFQKRGRNLLKVKPDKCCVPTDSEDGATSRISQHISEDPDTHDADRDNTEDEDGQDEEILRTDEGDERNEPESSFLPDKLFAHVDTYFSPVSSNDFALLGKCGRPRSGSGAQMTPYFSKDDPSFIVPPLGDTVRGTGGHGKFEPALPSFRHLTHLNRMLGKKDTKPCTLTVTSTYCPALNACADKHEKACVSLPESLAVDKNDMAGKSATIMAQLRVNGIPNETLCAMSIHLFKNNPNVLQKGLYKLLESNAPSRSLFATGGGSQNRVTSNEELEEEALSGNQASVVYAAARLASFHRLSKDQWTHSSVTEQPIGGVAFSDNRSTGFEGVNTGNPGGPRYTATAFNNVGPTQRKARTHTPVPVTGKERTEDVGDESVLAVLLKTQSALYSQMRENHSRRHQLLSRITKKDTTTTMRIRERWVQEVQQKYRVAQAWQSVRHALINGARDIQPAPKASANERLPNYSNSHEDDRQDYSMCCVCFSGFWEDSNPLVYCDVCHISVHSRCYGLVGPNDREWCCEFCTQERKKRPKKSRLAPELACCLCTTEGGALKRTPTGLWAHLTCALWLPNVRLGDIIKMEPVLGVEEALAERNRHITWPCLVCGQDYGLYVRCSHDGCTACIHPLCGWYAGLYMRVEEVGVDCRFDLYCEEHTPESALTLSESMNFAEAARLRCVEQREFRSRGRQDGSLESRKRNVRKKLLQDKARRAIRLQEDRYEPGVCCVCFQSNVEIINNREFEEEQRLKQVFRSPSRMQSRGNSSDLPHNEANRMHSPSLSDSNRSGKPSAHDLVETLTEDTATMQAITSTTRAFAAVENEQVGSQGASVEQEVTNSTRASTVRNLTETLYSCEGVVTTRRGQQDLEKDISRDNPPSATILSARGRPAGQIDTFAEPTSSECVTHTGAHDSSTQDQSTRSSARRKPLVLLRCDNCNMDVHQHCYGVTDAEIVQAAAAKQAAVDAQAPFSDLITGWVCTRCKQQRDQPIRCSVCQRRGGAMKPLSKSKTRWAHVACAIWIPELDFEDARRMEPIVGMRDMPRRRRRLHCYLCKQAGPCIQCSDDCDTSFHPLCNLLADAFMRIYDDYQTNSLDFAHYCLKHSPLFLIRNVDIPNSYTKLYRLKRDLDKASELLQLSEKRELKKLQLMELTFQSMENEWKQAISDGLDQVRNKKREKTQQSESEGGETEQQKEKQERGRKEANDAGRETISYGGLRSRASRGLSTDASNTRLRTREGSDRRAEVGDGRRSLRSGKRRVLVDEAPVPAPKKSRDGVGRRTAEDLGATTAAETALDSIENGVTSDRNRSGLRKRKGSPRVDSDDAQKAYAANGSSLGTHENTLRKSRRVAGNSAPLVVPAPKQLNRKRSSSQAQERWSMLPRKSPETEHNLAGEESAAKSKGRREAVDGEELWAGAAFKMDQRAMHTNQGGQWPVQIVGIAHGTQPPMSNKSNKCVQEPGKKARLFYKVHYINWNKRYDEWVEVETLAPEEYAT